jgi:type I protein arginine methyltransferase
MVDALPEPNKEELSPTLQSEPMSKLLQQASQIESNLQKAGVKNNDETCVAQYFKFYSKLAN